MADPDAYSPGAAARASERNPTRDALVEAALHLFGHKGFAAASTREIAARAGANVAAIAYHFGGKEGLRLACVEAIAHHFDEVLLTDGVRPPANPVAARQMLEAVVRSGVRFMASGAPAQDVVTFLLREVTEGGPFLDTLFARVLEPRHRLLCALWGAATGTEAEAEATRLAVFAMIGQVVYFRIGRPMILRRMGWQEVTPDAADRIAAMLVANLNAALDATERTKP
ncbi:MAG: CerR family C-terminal domain-containing protein [Paracoccaceae bacterium]|nr:CerR family C-terminal domain-containing protein [Paracoccaceae bacterium]